MRRPQFTLKSLLWLMAVVAAFFGGAEWARHRYQPVIEDHTWGHTLTTPDGSTWVLFYPDR